MNPATALAAWAVGTAWLILFIILERVDLSIADELADWIEIIAAGVALALFPVFRKWFGGWLAKKSVR